MHWYEIQPCLSRAKADVLLILDCCFAAQAMRGQLSSVDEATRRKYEIDDEMNITIFAASGMNGYSFRPGPQSFTTAFMNECDSMLQENSSVLVSELNYRLGNRDIGKEGVTIIDLPVLISSSPNTIKLQSLEQDGLMSRPIGSTIFLKVDLEGSSAPNYHEMQAEKIGNWLASNVPSSVKSISVTRVIDLVKASSELRKTIERENKSSLIKDNQDGKNDSTHAWGLVRDTSSSTSETTDLT